MKKYRESVAPFADYQQLIQLNPFDAVVCLKKVDTAVFEVVEFNDKLSLLLELQDSSAKNAEHFFSEPCWLQLSELLNQDVNQQHVLTLGTDLQKKTFVIHVQHLANSMVAMILRATQSEIAPYLQFVEQHVSPVLTTDIQGRIIHQNVAATSVLSREQHSLIGLDIFSLLESRYSNEFKLLFAKTIEGSAFGMPRCLLKGQLLSKEPFYLRTHPTYYNGEVIGVHLFVKEANSFMNDHEAFYYLALMDELTGIWNRKAFKEHWLHHLNDKKQEHKQAALILVDIDRFKKFNESLGESKGDELMRMFSHRLRELCYSKCSLYRYNSDEFIFVLKDATIQKIEHTANAILDVLKQPFMIDGQEYFISVSIGISLSPADGRDLETLVRKADKALFSAKEHGRSHYRYYREDMTAVFPNEALMEAHLRRAIEFNELSLHLQPQMDLANNSINSFEALLRWNNRKFGFVSPAQFIPIAEASGLIIEIGDWIIDEVCRYQREWQSKGYRPVRIAVNISPKQFRKENFARKIKAALKKYSVPPELLEVEITESSMTNVHETYSILTELKQLGVYVSVDDFGTGYSSLSYLKRYPIDIIKIDQSFIADIAKDDKNEAIIKAIISMSHNLGLEVIAEGIEEASQVDFLKRHRCQKGQGYLYNKPLPVETIVQQYFVS
ncbi:MULTISPECIES: bifunctional diguanylate cyclase/phosphodiesterase [Lysinibacillus]|uniref:Bifunctional diguanylate cyclase/phosphodiesterase n=1 Tax=Lysinibacillus fusiformis TaxID=28031 RepID=A0A2I0V599_9BACI|nr:MULTISPECIES: bifunctional diguanylate cyclase/phosphodiesterase [Lysinibacillus]KUF36251.1 diguanylate cyclase [Lysinibacillus sp. F5]MEE3806785.1 bifunctional diguanylate cyclase/phosphodiesterase [Lysinibacillus fusiformis]PKU53489.1 bifunctional diguanylate cyclase/phosphodiesterase [Lysinibacillus fusiformis]SCX76835.1 diguanylate cyclase (GGDEF) domain-containing protein [Lysinibacillus sp. SG9]SDB02266.1 diguanylate cyclase (GGDEF) domain-containing protein [Lysinibacillus sp. TC-37]